MPRLSGLRPCYRCVWRVPQVRTSHPNYITNIPQKIALKADGMALCVKSFGPLATKNVRSLKLHADIDRFLRLEGPAHGTLRESVEQLPDPFHLQVLDVSAVLIHPCLGGIEVIPMARVQVRILKSGFGIRGAEQARRIADMLSPRDAALV